MNENLQGRESVLFVKILAVNLDVTHQLLFEVSHARQCLRFEDFRKKSMIQFT
jgi:hypothetical protein